MFKIHDQPPPDIVECMSQSGHLYGIESEPYSIDGSMEFIACVNAWSNHLSCVTSLFPFLLRQIVDLADRSSC